MWFWPLNSISFTFSLYKVFNNSQNRYTEIKIPNQQARGNSGKHWEEPVTPKETCPLLGENWAWSFEILAEI